MRVSPRIAGVAGLLGAVGIAPAVHAVCGEAGWIHNQPPAPDISNDTVECGSGRSTGAGTSYGADYTLIAPAGIYIWGDACTMRFPLDPSLDICNPYDGGGHLCPFGAFNDGQTHPIDCNGCGYYDAQGNPVIDASADQHCQNTHPGSLWECVADSYANFSPGHCVRTANPGSGTYNAILWKECCTNE